MALFKEKVSTTVLGVTMASNFVKKVSDLKQNIESGSLLQALPSFSECKCELFDELLFDYMALLQLVVSQEFDIYKDSGKAKALSIIRGFYNEVQALLESNGISIPEYKEKLKAKQEHAGIAIGNATLQFENEDDVYRYLAAYFGNLLLEDCGIKATDRRINEESAPLMHSFITSQVQFIHKTKNNYKIYQKEIEDYL
jgi:hypothetical protein